MTIKPNIDIVIDCHDVELMLDFLILRATSSASAPGYR